MKYFFYGVLGLILRLRFPALPIEWLAIAAAYAYLERGLRFSLFLVMALAPVYGAYSLAPAWQIFLPPACALIVFRLLQANFNLMSWGGLGLLLAILAGADALFWNLWGLRKGDVFFPQSEIFWALLTVVTGTVLLPFLRHLLQQGWNRLPKAHKPMEELPLFASRFKQEPDITRVRKSLEFEKRF